MGAIIGTGRPCFGVSASISGEATTDPPCAGCAARRSASAAVAGSRVAGASLTARYRSERRSELRPASRICGLRIAPAAAGGACPAFRRTRYSWSAVSAPDRRRRRASPRQQPFGDVPAAGAEIGGERSGARAHVVDHRNSHRLGEQVGAHLVPAGSDIFELAPRAHELASSAMGEIPPGAP